MSGGGFDFPPASDSTTPIGSLTQRFDNLRQTFQTERDERAAAARAAAERASQLLPTPPSSMPRPRRRIPTAPQRNERTRRRLSSTNTATTTTTTSPNAYLPRSPTHPAAYQDHNSSSNSSSNSTTPRITARLRQVADGTRAQLRRLRQEMNEDNQDIAEELRERRDLLDRMSTHLDGILNHRSSGGAGAGGGGRSRSSGSASSSSTAASSDELSTRAETETRLRGIDTTSIPSTSSHTAPSSSTSSSTLPRRRSHKRRKLDHDGDVAMLEPYGRYGQVVPGQLKMEIVSCDGGEYAARDSRALHLENYRAENVLRNDGSVYCTKSSRCNMMLRQKGETLFHLDSLVIAAPKRGYTAPIQQGLVFVGMSADKLAAATASYSIHYTDSPTQGHLSRSPSPPHSRSDFPLPHNNIYNTTRPQDLRLSFLEAVNDDQIWQASSRNRSNFAEPPYLLPPPRPSQPSSATRSRLLPPSFPTLNATGHFVLEGDGDDDEMEHAAQQGNAFLDNCDWPPAPLISEPNGSDDAAAAALLANSSALTGAGLTRAPTPPPFTVTTVMESSEDEDDDADDRMHMQHHRRRRRAARENSHTAHPYGLPPLIPLEHQHPDSASDTEDAEEYSQQPHGGGEEASDNDLGEGMPRPFYRLRRPARRSSPGHIGFMHRHHTHQRRPFVEDLDEGEGEGDMLEPNARFFMPENDCRITIRFHPPVAGKFILLKLFSPQLRDGGNIDIEYVAAHGYSGPRFFPSVEMK